MNLTDVLNNVNTFIGDSSTDRISAADRYQAATEATAWLLEELGNEHMVDRAEIEYLPTVTWYKMDNLTPYLLTAGELRFKEDTENLDDFTRVEARDLTTMNNNRHAYGIERFDGDSYMGIVIPNDTSYPHQDLINFDKNDGLTYTGVNAENIVEETHAVSFDMTATGQPSTGLTTTTDAIDLSQYNDVGVLILEVEIPDVTDVNSVSIKFGTDISTDYYLASAAQDINGNALVEGVNTIKVRWADVTTVGTPDVESIVEWGFYINHETDKPLVDGFKFSDLRIAKPIYLNFKYIFYRVGKDASGSDIIEYTADTDVPFFIDRYPQYKFAVAHRAASILYKGLRLYQESGSEAREAREALNRYRKNFSNERDQGSTTFKVAGINFRNRRRITRR